MDIESFSRSGRGDKRRPQCGECEYLRARTLRESSSGRANIILSGIKQRTKRGNLPPSEIDKAWIMRRLKRGKCAVTGIAFEYTDGAGREKANPYVPSADRINPRLGYTKRNTQLVVWVYNRAKGEYGDSTFTRLASMYLEAKGWTLKEPR